MTFNPDNYEVYTDAGIPTKSGMPPQEIVDKYMTMYFCMPETKIEDMQRQDPAWQYDKQVRAFYKIYQGHKVYRFGHRVSMSSLWTLTIYVHMKFLLYIFYAETKE